MAEQQPNQPPTETEEEQRRAERKRRAEERRAADLQCIESLNWKNEGGRNPLNILPPEMWIAIFTNLRKPEDLKNVRDTCPQFRDCLGDRLTRDILLPMVLRIMGADE